jgi:hypothetical protein
VGGSGGSGGAGAPPGRRGPLPSLAELGAFDDAASKPAAEAPRRRLSGRLTDEDLRGATPTRSLHPDTPFETVRTPDGVKLRQAHEAQLAEQARREAARAASVAAKPAPAPSPAPPEDVLIQEAPLARPASGVLVTWDDLESAVDQGWMRPEMARALWARWLAHKPLAPVAAADRLAPPGPVPEELLAPPVDVSPPAGPAPAQTAPHTPDSASPSASAAPARPSEAGLDGGLDFVGEMDDAGDSGATMRERPVDAEPVGRANRSSPQADSEEPPTASASSAAFEPPETPEPSPFEHPQRGADSAAQRPETIEAEVLEPIDDARARWAREAAASPTVVEVVDVIEVPSLDPARRPVPLAAVRQAAWACLMAVFAGLCMALGHALLGPWGAAIAGAGWAWMAGRWAGRFQREERLGRAVAAAYLQAGLVTLTLWQMQLGLDLWPDARPMDLFSDASNLRAGDPWQGLDGRWLTLALGPLVPSAWWLLRLRRPALLLPVTVLLWGVAFQIVAGVLQSMGLAFQGLSSFALLMGVLTLAAAQSIDLQIRRSGLVDFARWVYLGGAVMGLIGWLSLATGPLVLLPLRYLAWVVFLAWALSVQRGALLLLGLLAAVFESAWWATLSVGSEWAGFGVWVIGLVAVALLAVFAAPKLTAWSKVWRFWMPAAWRRVYDASPSHNKKAQQGPR